MTTKKQVKDESEAMLRKFLAPGDRVYTVLRHVSASGMTRRIDLYAIKDNQTVFISGYAANFMGWRRHSKKDGIVVGGCGMDMGFHLVYNLGRCLWPGGDGKTTSWRNGEQTPETDGGYLLKQEWI